MVAAAAAAAAAVRATKALQVQNSKKRPYVSACGLFLFNATNFAAFCWHELDRNTSLA
jgi:hypothetical protein